jgi:hypothetical protein
MSRSGRVPTRFLRLLAVAMGIALTGAACGGAEDGGATGDGATTTAPGASGTTLEVPGDHPTIQAAVDAAEPGDLILVGPGTYAEEVSVETEHLVIRGTDRNTVIIDGGFERENGIKVLADGVAVENLTVRNANGNGIFWTGSYEDDYVLKGYRASYVTAYNNGRYGIYAFNAANGLIEHSFGSGHPDSAYYIGQCNPCDAVIRDSVAEKNMLGYSGTNSSGNLFIVGNTWRDNRAGIVPNSLTSEKLAPQNSTTIVGNLVEDNNAEDAPETESFKIAYGNGIVLAGGQRNLVERNVVRGHLNGGIVVTDLPESFKPEGNQVLGNELSGNTVDLVYLTVEFASEAFGNCFAGNTYTSSVPEQIEAELPCTGEPGSGWDLSVILSRLTAPPPQVDWRTVAAPGPQPNMPDAASAPARPALATVLPPPVDLAAVRTPGT